MVTSAKELLEAAMAKWIDTALALEECPPLFRTGRTFLGCTNTQLENKRRIKKANQKKDAAIAMEALERQVKQKLRAHHEHVMEEHSRTRRLLRIKAAEDQKKDWEKGWDVLHEAATTQRNKAITEVAKDPDLYKGLNEFGFAACHIKPLDLVPDSEILSEDQLQAINNSAMVLLDIRTLPDIDVYLRQKLTWAM